MHWRESIKLTIIPALTALLVWSATAHAHPPYFTQSEQVILPNGKMGEMRVIAGDGIFFADPTRLLILDDDNQVIARGPARGFVEIVCPEALSCYGYDYREGKIIEPDPAGFEANFPKTPIDADRSGLWDLEAWERSWGVSVRSATWPEIFKSELLLLLSNPIRLGFFIVGALAALSIYGTKLPTRSSGVEMFWWFMFMAMRAMALFVLLFIALYGIALTAPIWSRMIFSLLIGFAATLGVVTWLGRRRKQASETHLPETV